MGAGVGSGLTRHVLTSCQILRGSKVAAHSCVSFHLSLRVSSYLVPSGSGPSVGHARTPSWLLNRSSYWQLVTLSFELRADSWQQDRFRAPLDIAFVARRG